MAPISSPAAPVAGAEARRVPPWAIPVAATITLILLAAWGLGAKSFWIDEAISVGATNELVATWTGTGGTMAGYYALLTPWSLVSTDPAWLRALSVLFAAASIPVVWSLARRTYDQRVALLATACTATAWVVVRYAQEARSYALILLLTSASWWALLRAVQATDDDERTRYWRVFAVVTIVAPLAHGLAVLQFAGQLAFLATLQDRSLWFVRLRPVLIGVVAVMSVLVVAGASDVASWIPPLSLEQIGDLVAAFTGPRGWMQLVLGATLMVGAAVCVQRSRRLDDPLQRSLALVPLAWGVIPVILLFVASAARPYLLARYVVGSAPGMALLIAFAVLGPAPTVRLGRAAVVAIPVLACVLVAQLDLHREPGDNWNAVAAAVAADAQAGDAVVFPNPSVRSAFDYAWMAEATTSTATPDALSPVEPLGSVRRFYTIIEPTSLNDEVAADAHDRIWVVDQEGAGFASAIEPFLADPAIANTFRVVADTTADGGIRLVLLERT